jgi:hypothetical protein
MGNVTCAVLVPQLLLSSSPQHLAQPSPTKEAEGLQQRYQLIQLHGSVLNKLLSQLDTRSKCALMCTCTQAQRLVSKQEWWRQLVFDTADEQHGLHPSVLFSLLKRSQGSCEVIQLARWAWQGPWQACGKCCGRPPQLWDATALFAPMPTLTAVLLG